MREETIRINEDNLVRLLKSLIKIESVNPHAGGTGEAKISNFIAGYLENVGLEVHMQDIVGDRFNVIGILRGESGDRTLMMNGHMDTVGVERMIISPFEPSVENNNLHGRGACDSAFGKLDRLRLE